MTFQPVCPWSLRVGREEGVSREAESCVVAASVLCASPHQVPRLRRLRSGKEMAGSQILHPPRHTAEGLSTGVEKWWAQRLFWS